MAEPDDQIKDTIRAFLESAKLHVESIPEADDKTPDFSIDPNQPDGSLLEVKTKQDDPGEMADIESELKAGLIAKRTKPTDPWSRLDNIVAYGVKQFKAYDPSHTVPRFIWFHCEGMDAELYSMRLQATLYGSQKLVSTQIPNMATCYYFWNSSFFRFSDELEGVIISEGEEAQLNLNEFSSRFAHARSSSLGKALSSAEFYPKKYAKDPDVLINDSVANRKDKLATLAYLRTKYSLEHLQTIDMNQYSGLIRTFEDA